MFAVALLSAQALPLSAVSDHVPVAPAESDQDLSERPMSSQSIDPLHCIAAEAAIADCPARVMFPADARALTVDI